MSTNGVNEYKRRYNRPYQTFFSKGTTLRGGRVFCALLSIFRILGEEERDEGDVPCFLLDLGAESAYAGVLGHHEARLLRAVPVGEEDTLACIVELLFNVFFTVQLSLNLMVFV